MMLFLSLSAGVVSFLLRWTIFPKRKFPPPNAQPEDTVQNLPSDPIIGETVARLPLKKQNKRRRISCKSRSDVTFKPRFRNRQSAHKLVYLALIRNSSTVVFFSDLYHHTFGSKTDHVASRLLDAHIPEGMGRYTSPALHCNGVFVLPTANNVLVCNPATKQVITLPQSSNEHTPRIAARENEGVNKRVGFGFLQSTQAFKVARFFYRSYDLKEKRYSMGFEVFTIGLSTSWRVLPKDPPYPIRNSCWSFTGNCIYFYVWRRLDRSAPNSFLCFNLRNEKFSLLFPPFSMKRIDVVHMMLTNLQGRLCLSLLSMNNTKFSVFTAKRGGNNLQWTPKFCFDVVVEPDDGFIIPIAEYQGNLLTRVMGRKCQLLKCYKSKDGSFEEVDGELEDVKMEKEGFNIFLTRPWFCVSSYQESLFKL